MMIDGKIADAYPTPGKEDTGLNLRNETGFRALKMPKAGPLN